jgi:hypothetical protein
MREILFRGKRVDNGEWDFGDLEHNGKNVPKWVNGNKIVPESVGQFTGLTDKNGKKIFEGDIMQLCSACYPCLVYWDGKGWAWKQNGKRREIDLTREKMCIIGNLYDNPELLRSENG